MKNFKIFAAILTAVFALASCEKANKGPVLQEPDGFVLNTPAYVNGVYDLSNSENFILTWSQPDYGFTAAVTYTMQVSKTEDFASFEEFGTSTSAKAVVPAIDLAVALTNIFGADPALYPMTQAIFVRVKAALTNSGKGECLSNVIELPQVKFDFSLPPVNAPTDMYLVGDFNGWNWGNSTAMVPVWGNSDQLTSFWQIVYLTANGMKFNSVKEWNGSEVGYDGCKFVDNAGANITRSDDGNLVVGTAGWYLVRVDAQVSGRDILYTISYNEPKIYLFGVGTVGDVWSAEEANLFTIPSAADGEFVSPAFDQDLAGDDSGCIRACVVLDGHEWWHSEFIVLDGKIAYRGTGEDQERVGGAAGQKLYLNFSNGTASVK